MMPRNPKPGKETRPHKLTPRRRGQGDIEPTTPKSYTIPFPVLLEIRQLAPEYGSQGRAIQVASELLLRMKKPPNAGPPMDPKMMVRMTYKLPPRTIKVIDELAHTQYDSAAEVITASMKTLKMKKIE
jgi:hypothetical protein